MRGTMGKKSQERKSVKVLVIILYWETWLDVINKVAESGVERLQNFFSCCNCILGHSREFLVSFEATLSNLVSVIFLGHAFAHLLVDSQKGELCMYDRW